MKKTLPKNRQYRKIFSIKMPLCLAEIYLPTHCFGTESLTGRGIHNIAYEMEGGTLVGYFSEEDIEKVGKKGLQKFLDDQFVENLHFKVLCSLFLPSDPSKRQNHLLGYVPLLDQLTKDKMRDCECWQFGLPRFP